MNTTKKLSLVSVAGAAAMMTGCVNMEVWGIPLGPSGEQGLQATGVMPTPTPTAGVCQVAACGGVHQSWGYLEVTSGATAGGNKYIAFVDLTNKLQANAPVRTGNTQFGSNSSDTVTILGADVRYEYPTLTPDKRFLPSYQQRPADGLIFQEQTLAAGGLRGTQCEPIGVTVIDPEMARALAQDTDIQGQLQNNGAVPITARIRINARNDTGAHLASNELSYTVYLVPTGTLTNACAANPPTCTAPQVPTEIPSCLPGQDRANTCVCQ